MSTATASRPIRPEPNLPKEIPHVTEAYRNAYRTYVLVAGFLVAWELPGVTLDIKAKLGVELKSPGAGLLILLILLIYTGYKMTIEWLQCDAGRREKGPAKWDFYIAHIIGACALSISVVQYLSSIRVTDLLGQHKEASLNFVFGAAGTMMIVALVRLFRNNVGPVEIILILLALIYIGNKIIVNASGQARGTVISAIAGAFFATGLLIYFKRLGALQNILRVATRTLTDLDPTAP